MTPEWLEDGRKVPDDVMYYIRRMAVYAVRVLGQSPEKVAEAYNFDRSCIYRWLKQYDEGGFETLESHMPRGTDPIITQAIEDWMKLAILNSTPFDFGYDTTLWTCPILAALLLDKFRVKVSDTAVRQHLKAMGLTCQKPEYQDVARDEEEIAHFFNDKFPRIQRLAEKMDADIAFEDEAGVGVMTRHGRTWGMSGKTPVIKVSMLRGGYNLKVTSNVLSAVTAQGEMDYSIQDGTVNGERYIEFLGGLIAGRKRPLIILVDHASFHHSRQVRDYVGAHRSQLRVFFLPKRAPEYNPDEQVWNEVKNNRIGKQPVKNKDDLKARLTSAFDSLKQNTQRIISFFHLPDTKYAAGVA
jgi:transposase